MPHRERFAIHNGRGIRAVASSSLAMFWPGAIALGYTGVLSKYWQDTLGVGRGATGAIMFFMLASLGVFMYPAGRWQEKLGPRLMMSIGGAMTGLSVLIVAFASHIWLVYLWGFLTGTASCFITIPALTVVQRWYPNRRGLVSGIVNLVFASSAALMAPVFAAMLTSMGYLNMNLMVMALALVSGIGVAQFATLPPSGFGVASPGGGEHPIKASPGPLPVRSSTLRQALRTRNFWLVWTVWAFQGAANIAMVTMAVNFGVARGFVFTAAVVILTGYNIGNSLSSTIMGLLSDRIRRTLVMSTAFLATAGAYFILPHLSTLAVMILLAGVVGFGFGTLFSVTAPLVVDCFGMSHFGAIYGVIFTAYGFAAGLMGPVMGGVLVDLSGGSYTVGFTYLGCLALVAAVMIHFVKPKRASKRILFDSTAGRP